MTSTDSRDETLDCLSRFDRSPSEDDSCASAPLTRATLVIGSRTGQRSRLLRPSLSHCFTKSMATMILAMLLFCLLSTNHTETTIAPQRMQLQHQQQQQQPRHWTNLTQHERSDADLHTASISSSPFATRIETLSLPHNAYKSIATHIHWIQNLYSTLATLESTFAILAVQAQSQFAHRSFDLNRVEDNRHARASDAILSRLGEHLLVCMRSEN